MKNFAERLNALYSIVKPSNFSDAESTKKVTKEDIENAENEAVLAEMKARKATAEKTIRDAQAEVVNFAEEKKEVKIDHSKDDEYYKMFKKYLNAAKTKEHFDNFTNAAQDPGFCNRFVEDEEFQSKFIDGDDLDEESDDYDSIIKFRKSFVDQVKKSQSAFIKTAKDSEKSAKDSEKNSYIAKSNLIKNKDASERVIAVKYALLSNLDEKAKSELILKIAMNPQLAKELVEDKEFIKELKKLSQKKNFDKTENNNAEESKDKVKEFKSDIDKIKSSEDLIKFLEEVVKDSKDIKMNDPIKFGETPDESKKYWEDKLKQFYKSESDKKKELADTVKKAIEDAKNMSSNKDLGIGIHDYIIKKIQVKAKKKGSELTKEEKDLNKDAKSIEAAYKANKRKSNNKLAKGMLAGMEEPGLSFLSAIFDYLAERGTQEDGMKLVAEQAKENANELTSDAELSEDDIEVVELTEDEKKDADSIIKNASKIKDEADTSEIISSMEKVGFTEDQAREVLDPEIVSDEEVDSGKLVGVDNKSAISKLAMELGAPKSVEALIPEKPIRGKDEDKEHYKARLALYKSEMATWKTLATADNKMTMLKVAQALDKQKLENAKTGKVARSIAFLGMAGKMLKGGTNGIIDSIGKLLKIGTSTISDLGETAGKLAKDLGTSASNASEFVEALGKASKETLDGAGSFGKQVLEGAGDLSKDFLEGAGKGIEYIEQGVGSAVATGRKSPEQIAEYTKAWCDKKNVKLDETKLLEVLRHEKVLNKIEESIEGAKAKAEKNSIKWSSKLDKLTAKGLMDIAKAENKGELEVTELNAEKNIEEAEAALDIAKKEIKANKEMTDNELESEIEKQLIEQNKDKKLAKLMAKAAVKMCKQDTKAEVKENNLKNQTKVDKAKTESKIDETKMNSAITETNEILKSKDKITKSELKETLKEKLSDENVDDSISEAFIESLGDDLNSVLEESIAGKYTSEASFTSLDPMESIIDGEVSTSTQMHNFAAKKEFKDYEDTLNKWWDLY